MGFTTWAFFGPKIYADHAWLDVLAKLDVGYDPRRGTGNGDGETGNVPSPASPDGDRNSPLSSSQGLNTYQIHPLVDEIPVGDRESRPVAIPRKILKIWNNNLVPVII